jgi:hypothetical protein
MADFDNYMIDLITIMLAMEGIPIVNCRFLDIEILPEHQKGFSE